MTVADVISERGVTEVLHFTTNGGLTGILATEAVLPRSELSAEKHLSYVLNKNCPYRKDVAWVGYVSLSLSEVNAEFFRASRNWKREQDIWWVVLAFDPVILTENGVYFTTTNNIYTGCVRAEGVEGLASLFSDRVHRYSDRYAFRSEGKRANQPTCQHAEALYPGRLSLQHLLCVYVPNDQVYAEVRALQSSFDRIFPVEVKPEMFA